MKLLTLSMPRSGSTLLNDYVQQKMEVPHVPLKLSFSNRIEDADFIVSLIRNPKDNITSIIATKMHIDNLNNVMIQPEIGYIENAVQEYLKFINDTISFANKIYVFEDLINNPTKIIMDLFDTLKLDDENYKTKTGSLSLRDDVLNKNVSLNSAKGLKTCKESMFYNEVVRVLSLVDLTILEEKYNLALEKSTRI